jgi:hypothetical protein
MTPGDVLYGLLAVAVTIMPVALLFSLLVAQLTDD